MLIPMKCLSDILKYFTLSAILILLHLPIELVNLNSQLLI